MPSSASSGLIPRVPDTSVHSAPTEFPDLGGTGLSMTGPTEALHPSSDGLRAEGCARNRSFIVAWVLSLTMGFLGADRFYTGRYATGVLKLLTLGGIGAWWLFDLVVVMAGGLRSDSRPLDGYEAYREMAWIMTGFLLIVGYSMQIDEVIAGIIAAIF